MIFFFSISLKARRFFLVGFLLCVLSCLAIISTASAAENMPPFIEREEGHYRVALRSGERLLLHSPAEGLWSIATDFTKEWPCKWLHAHPDSLERSGEWTILRGALETSQGIWRLSDAYRPRGELIQCVRRFAWEGKEVAQKVTLSARFIAPGQGPGVLLPGILYYGNPSGAESGRVPVYAGNPGEEVFFEEHRYPLPFASFEWLDGDRRWGCALHTLPSPVPYGKVADQWWSLGVTARKGETELALLSGPCAANGKRGVVKARQREFLPIKGMYLDVPPGATIEKTFYLQSFPVDEEGSGFRPPLKASLDLFSPALSKNMPSFEEIVRAKFLFAKSRWLEEGENAGFRMYQNRDLFVMGWCGQAAAPGYALQVLGDNLGKEQCQRMAQMSLDVLSKAEFYEGGFRTRFSSGDGTWKGDELLSQGQGMLNFANAIRVGRKSGLDTSRWEAFLRKACRFHAERILGKDWRPKSTNEGFFIAPLCAAFRLFDEPTFLKAAEKAGRHYAERSVNMREPYWGGTLDARCEDKEGAWAAFQGFLALYEETGEKRYLRWAQHACDVVLTYVVAWDIDLPAGRLRDHRFQTRGWTVVSPQNQHLDVYGVIMAPSVYRLGVILEREDLKELALLMFQSCGQLIDPSGSQGEQIQHTNFAQSGKMDDVFALRGGYAEHWTVFWITAHFLNAAAQFQEQGLPIAKYGLDECLRKERVEMKRKSNKSNGGESGIRTLDRVTPILP